MRRLACTMFGIALAGALGIAAAGPMHPVLQAWLQQLTGKSPQS